VKKATVVINQVVDQITTAASGSSGRSILFLDATAYLFASTKVAKVHPTLLESIVVLHYQSHLPGELSRAWPHCKRKAENDVIIVERSSALGRVFGFIPGFILSVSITVVLMMQSLGTMSFNFQRVVIRFVQPLLLSGLTLMWLFASHSEAGLIITMVGSAILFAAFSWRQYYVYTKEQEEAHRIAADDVFQAESDDELQDIESVPTSRPSTPVKRAAAMAQSKAAEPVYDDEKPEQSNAPRAKASSFFGSSSRSDSEPEEQQRRGQRVPFAAQNRPATTIPAVPVVPTATAPQTMAAPPKKEERFKFFDSSSDDSSSVFTAPSAKNDEPFPQPTAQQRAEEEAREAQRAEGVASGFQISEDFSVSKFFGSSDSEELPADTDTHDAVQGTRKISFFDTDSDEEEQKPTVDPLDYPHADDPEPVQGNRGKASSFFEDSDDEGVAYGNGYGAAGAQEPALQSEMEAEVDGPLSFFGSSSDNFGDDEDQF
jgi:hypothetical protein